MSKEKKRNRSRKRAGYARGDSYAKRRGRKLKNLQNATEKKEQAHRDVDRLRQMKEAAERELYHEMRWVYLREK